MDLIMDVIILQGISGSGKTTYCETLRKLNPNHKHAVVSADEFMVDKTGAYSFDPSKLPECHQKCLLKYEQILREGGVWNKERLDILFVDNTNCTNVEIAPYMALAQAYRYNAWIYTLLCPIEVAFKRSQHKIPVHSLMNQHLALLRDWDQKPSWWHRQVAFAEY